MIKFDKYTLYARLFPAIIAAAPALALAAILISWKNIGLPQYLAGLALAVLLMVFSDVARRLGRKIEPRLFAKMGGIPTITMQRHRDDTLDSDTKLRLHLFIASKLQETAPSQTDEQYDTAKADSFYERGATWLRENTRNTKKFALLFNENITYGYRRNLFALKWFAIALNVSITIGCAIATYLQIPQKTGIDLSPVYVIAALHAAYLLLFSTEKGVVEAARLYGRQLLLSAQSRCLNKQEKNRSTKKSR
jgi:hypothetical protein